MQTNKHFYNLFLIIIAVSVSLLLLLVGVNEFAKPQVTHVALSMRGERAAVINQTAELRFNRPMQRDSVIASLQIQPQVAFKPAWRQGNLIINFPNGLHTDTEYTITISADAKDAYGGKFENNFNYRFTTQPAKLAYVQRPATIADEDKVVITDPSFKQRDEIFKVSSLKYFGLNYEYLAVVSEVPLQPSKLFVVDIATRQSKEVVLGKMRITRLTFSPTRNEFAFTAQTVTEYNNTYIPDSMSSIYVYNIEQGKLSRLQLPDEQPDIADVSYSTDGVSLLYRLADTTYELVNTQDTSITATSDRYLSTGGFNRSWDWILFLEHPFRQTESLNTFITAVRSDHSKKSVTTGNTYVIDPVFLNTSDGVLYSQKYQDTSGAVGLFEVVWQAESGEQKVLAHVDGFSLELPKSSLDDRYVVMERYSQEDLSNYENPREMGFQAKPYNASLLLYDATAQTLIDPDVKGVNAVWVR